MSNLNPRQFYHGTTAELQPGDTVKPASEVGYSNYPSLYKKEPWRAKKVFMTTDEHDAWGWSHMGTFGRQSKVYEVKPVGKALPTESGPTFEHTARHARVTRRIDIPPPLGPGGHVQGELPGHYWAGEGMKKDSWEGGENQRKKETAEAEQGVRDRRLQALHEGKIPFKGQGKLF